jgi:MarR family transcriptional regulator for hemolysin
MPTAFENDLLVLLSDVARHMRTYADAEAQRFSITLAQLIILARLEDRPDISQNELATIAEVAPITIARLVDRLEDFGLIKRCPDPKDRRIWRLRLTSAALPTLREIKRLRAKLHSVMTKGIEPAVLKTMARCLWQMKENVTERRLAEANS